MDLNNKRLINYLLLPVSIVFYLLSNLRRLLYKINLIPVQEFSVPVIVVGNITVGGTGKTPIVISLVKHLKQQDKKVGVVSRGYGGSHNLGSLFVDKNTDPSISGDEPLLISIESNSPVVVNKNRAQAVKDLINNYGVDLVISDDGLQHYSMARDVEIAVIDGQRRFGNGFFLPSGPLRESISRLKTVDFIINNGALNPGETSCELIAKEFVNIKTGERAPVDFFQGKYCHGVAGIGHPQRFFDTLIDLNIKLEPHKFADHFVYKESDLEFDDNHPILMTSKDCVKCRQFANNQMWYLQVETDLGDDFLNRLNAKL